MFSRWNLSRNPFDPNPISLGTLDWFVGRKREVELCRNFMADRSVILVEGDLGVGTTSFGNVVRYHGPFRTTRMEIAVYRGWNSQTLLENAMVAILHDLLEDPETRKSQTVKAIRPLVQHVERSVHSAGISLVGFGGQVTRNVAVTQPGIIPMETLRQNLLALAEAFKTQSGGASFVLQLNNLDPSLTFTKAELITFLNDIRDNLQLPGFSWMLVGKSGLARFITENVPRLRSIIAHDVILQPLSLSEVGNVVAKRITACHCPIEKERIPLNRGCSGKSTRPPAAACVRRSTSAVSSASR